MQFLNADIRDLNALDKIFNDFKPEAVIHFAGLKTVGESVADPLRYYDVNVGAHESSQIGEEPIGVPNNLIPYIAQVADGRRKHLNIYLDVKETFLPFGQTLQKHLKQ